MFKIIPLIILFFSTVPRTHAQSFWNSKHAYLGQTPPTDTPKMFAHDLLIKDSGIALDRSAFSKDGKEFYYCTADHWFNSKGAAIRYFKFKNNKWNGPFVLVESLYAPTFSIDDKSLYFLGGGKGVIMQSHRADSGWTKPEMYLKRNYGIYDFTPAKSGKMYAASNIHGDADDFSIYDICIIPKCLFCPRQVKPTIKNTIVNFNEFICLRITARYLCRQGIQRRFSPDCCRFKNKR